MVGKRTINVPLNRVEGDLDVSVEIDNGIVTDVKCSGIMYRGFEKIMVGRGALDGLVITPRICGICSTAHLMCAAMALDTIANVSPPPDAIRVRNVTLMAEMIQSDMRHGFLMYTSDFVNPAYQKKDFYESSVKRFEPFKGEAVIETIRETKKILEIVAILGGQWPHSSFMVPGGVASIPNQDDLVKCMLLLEQYRKWYEEKILGCSLERWQAVKSSEDLDQWLEEKDTHRNGHLGFYLQVAKSIGLEKKGKGYQSFISYGGLKIPEGSALNDKFDQGQLIPSGFYHESRHQAFDNEKILEHVAFSWFEDTDAGVHPSFGQTNPYATGYEGQKYSWAKAPRYDGNPSETGPLAEMIIGQNPLFVDLLKKQGANVCMRQMARLVRPAELIPAMKLCLSEIVADGVFYQRHNEIIDGEGYGLTQVTRGALGHWVRIEEGKIAAYQIISPTTWNLSPRDSEGIRGPAEEALIGACVNDITNPVELGHIVRSFDACLVCTVHTVDKGNKSQILI
jgi:uptake hydrogenase large subunit